jgi:nucleotide-binding universal stress UspA family protein
MLGNNYVATEEQMSIFPTKILLASDGSVDSELALSTAVELANSTSSELHVVHVVDPYNPDLLTLRDPAFESILQVLEQEAQELLDGQVRKIEEAGGTVQEAHSRGGRKDQEIVNLGEEIGAGLIVMGSRGLGGVRRALMGSVADSVVRHAHCPVLVVRKEAHQAAR